MDFDLGIVDHRDEAALAKIFLPRFGNIDGKTLCNGECLVSIIHGLAGWMRQSILVHQNKTKIPLSARHSEPSLHIGQTSFLRGLASVACKRRPVGESARFSASPSSPTTSSALHYGPPATEPATTMIRASRRKDRVNRSRQVPAACRQPAASTRQRLLLSAFHPGLTSFPSPYQSLASAMNRSRRRVHDALMFPLAILSAFHLNPLVEKPFLTRREKHCPKPCSTEISFEACRCL